MQRYNYFLIPQTFFKFFLLKSKISFSFLIYINSETSYTLLYYTRANNNLNLQGREKWIHSQKKHFNVKKTCKSLV